MRFLFLGDQFDVFWGFLGNIGCRFQEGLGSSFSRENMTYFGSWILTHIYLFFFDWCSFMLFLIIF